MAKWVLALTMNAPENQPSPVNVSARLTHAALSTGRNDDTFLCQLYSLIDHTWEFIQAQDIIIMTQYSVKDLNLHNSGISSNLFCTHFF